VTPAIQILVLGAIPPLTRKRAADRTLGIDRWIVLAYPPPTVAKRVEWLVERMEAAR
jgi:hypothetical protein